MPAYAALLRGVNVGRAKRVPMAAWRAQLQALGCTDVQTLLNSGNAVFRSSARAPAALAARIREALLQGLQVDAPVLVKPAREIAAVITGNPLSDVADDPARLLLAFAPDAAGLAALAPLAAVAQAPERFVLGPHAAYLWCANGILQSAAADALLGRAGRAVTTRNWATLGKIHAALAALG